MKPKNAPKSRKTHCLVGFFAAKTGQNRASAGNFGFAPKNFYRKFRCLSPKFFGAGCYTNFLRKNAVFHGRAAFVIPGLRGRRRYGVKSLSFAGFMAKNTPFSCIMRAKDCACSLPGARNWLLWRAERVCFIAARRSFAWRLFAFVDRIFLVKDIRSAQTA